MRRFLLKLAVVVVALCATDYIFGTLLEKMYYSQCKSDFGFTTKALDEQTADVVILGSSRAQHHYNPAILADSLQGLEVYNAGRNGHFLVYQTSALQMMLDRYSPKVVVLDLTPYDLADDNGDSDFDKLSSLLPYSHHASYRDVLRKRSWYEPIKALSKVYRYNSTFLKMLSPESNAYQENGYEPLYGKLDGKSREKERIIVNNLLSQKKINELDRLITMCEDKGINLIILTSPYYADYPESPTISYVTQLAQKKGIEYKSWLNDSDYDNPDWYHTADHLNDEGADIFSKEAASFIKSALALN